MNFPDTTILHPEHFPSGFATPDFQFAAIPFDNQYMIIAGGQQLEVVTTRQLAVIRLEQLKSSHRTLKKGTKTPTPQKSQKKAKTSSGQKGSQGAKRTSGGGRTTKPKSKSVPAKKPHTLSPNPLLDALS